MLKKLHKMEWRSVLFIVILLWSVAGALCHSLCQPDNVMAAEKIAVNLAENGKTTNKTIAVGGKCSISAKYNGKTIKSTKLMYSYSNKKVVVVSKKGVIVAIRKGKATVNVKYTVDKKTYLAHVKCIVVDEDEISKYETEEEEEEEEILPPEKVKISASRQSSTKANISWKKVDSVDGYEVCWSTAKNMKNFKFCTTKANTDSLYILNLKRDSAYFFRVRAYRKDGKEKYFGEYSKTVKVEKYNLQTPKLKASIDSYNLKMKLSWSKIDGADGYEVWERVNKKAYHLKKDVGTKKASYTFSYASWDKESSHSYYVRAYYKDGDKKVYSGKSNQKIANPSK